MADFHGDQYLFQGLQQFGQAIASAQERKNEEGKLAQSLRKTLSLMEPDAKGHFDTMGLPDLQGYLQGTQIKQAQARYEAAMQEYSNRNRLAQLQIGQQEALPQFVGAFAGAQPSVPQLQDYYESGTQPYPEVDFKTRMQAGLKAAPAAISPQLADDMMRYYAISEKNDINKFGVSRIVDPETGAVYYQTSTGAMHPAGFTTKSGESEVSALKDGDKIIGYKIRTPRGPRIIQVRQDKEGASEEQMLIYKSKLSALANKYRQGDLTGPEYDAGLDAIEEEIHKPKAPEKKTEEKKLEEAPPKEKRVKGVIYQTPKGPAEWNGVGWILK